MKERPILFSAPMVRAILAGTKSQTRRVVKLYDGNHADKAGCFRRALHGERGEYVQYVAAGHWGEVLCPYGVVGDRLWVRETWSMAKSCNVHDPFYRADGETRGRQTSLSYHERESRWRPSIHMPRWASRITLEVTSVRVERIQEITQADCIAEGMPEKTGAFMHHVIADYRRLWGEINGAESWKENPWVWVIEFKRVSP